MSKVSVMTLEDKLLEEGGEYIMNSKLQSHHKECMCVQFLFSSQSKGCGDPF